MTSPDQNEPTTMETYLEALQHNRGSEGSQSGAQFGFTVQFTPTFGYVGDVESAERARREYEETTASRFSTYRQSKDFGKEDFCMEHHQVCWEDCSKLRQGHIAFDHVPYIVVGIKRLDCQHGRDRHLAKKRRSLETINAEPPDERQGEKPRRKQITGKKVDCPAQIYYRDVLKFPEYAITANSAWRRKTMSEKLRKALASDTPVVGERRIYVKFPDHDEHRGHQTKSIVATSISADQELCDKMEVVITEALTVPLKTKHQPEEYQSKERSPKGKTPPLPEETIPAPSRGYDIPPGGESSPPTIQDHHSKSPDRSQRAQVPPSKDSISCGSPSSKGKSRSSLSNDLERRPTMSSSMEYRLVNPADTEGMALPPPLPQVSILSQAATKCRKVLQQLMKDTYMVKDPLVLGRACEQLQEVQKTLESEKQKKADLSIGTAGDVSCYDQSVSMRDSSQGSDRVAEKRTQKRGASDIDKAKRKGHRSPSSKHRKRKLPKIILEELSSDRLLSDLTVEYAQSLILDKFPHVKGFEEPVHGCHMLFSAAEGEFGQIMQDGKQRWVFVSSIGTESNTVRYYDSLGTRKIPDAIRKQIAAIVSCQEPQITVDVQSVQSSKTIADTGLFAIAFAVSVLHSEDPSEVSYDVTVMRQHLHHCFQMKDIQPFPKTEEVFPRTVRRLLTVEVFCVCRMPWNASAEESRIRMAQCEACEEWWHSSCCGIPEEVFTEDQSWKCPRCEDLHSAVTALNSLQAAIVHAQGIFAQT